MPEPIVIEAQDGGLIPTPPEPVPFVDGIPADPVPPVDSSQPEVLTPPDPVTEVPMPPPEIPAIGFVPIAGELTFTKKVRGNRIVCNNPRNGAPTVEFGYELVTTYSDGTEEVEQIPSATITFDPDRVIYLQSPVDDAFFGAQTTWMQVFVALRSAALNEHLRRINDSVMDNRPVHAPPPPPEPEPTPEPEPAPETP